MNKDQSRHVADDAQAHDPMEEFRRRFAEVRALMDAQIGPGDHEIMVYRPEVFDKVRDMVRGQILLLRAEKLLDEEFKRLRETDEEKQLDKLRDQIGRKLDRIRESLDPGGIFGQPDSK